MYYHMNTSLRNVLIALAIVVVAGLAVGGYIQYRNTQSETASNDGQVAGTEDDGASAPDGTLETFEVKLNETASKLGVKITPVEVVEESRCPIDVQCIQAGTVRVRASVTERGAPAEMASDYMFELNVPMTIGVDQITLVDVMPVPRSGTTIKPEDYRFTFSVVKGGGSEFYKG